MIFGNGSAWFEIFPSGIGDRWWINRSDRLLSKRSDTQLLIKSSGRKTGYDFTDLGNDGFNIQWLGDNSIHAGF
jgi:hypothetical protein